MLLALFGLAGLIFAVLVLWRFLGERREPVYAGVKLSVWLRTLDYSDRPADMKSRGAIQAIGTNCLPWVLPMLYAKDSAIKARVIDLAHRQNVVPVPWMPARFKVNSAMAALRTLEKSALMALPRLEELFENPDYAWGSMEAMITMLPESAPVLARGLTNRSPQIRMLCASYLTKVGPDGHRMIPTLIGALDNPSPEFRVVAAFYLGLIKAHPELRTYPSRPVAL